jgi:hypothetical protein
MNWLDIRTRHAAGQCKLATCSAGIGNYAADFRMYFSDSFKVSNVAQTEEPAPVIIYSPECVERSDDRRFVALILRPLWLGS